MDLGEIISVARARWYILLPMLVLAVGLGMAAFVLVPTSYQSTTTVSLLSSPAATDAATPGENNDNPFLNFNGSLVATADFLGRSLQSTDAQADLLKMGVTEDFEVGLAEGAQGPFLTFTVTGTDQDHLLASTATIARFAQDKLAKIQSENGVKSQDMVRMTEIIPPQKPEPQLKDKLKVVIAAGGGTTALALLLTFVVESVARSRRRRQELAAPAPATAAAPTTVGTGSAGVPGRRAPARQPQQPPSPARDEPTVQVRPAVLKNGAEGRAKPGGAEETVILVRPPTSPAPRPEGGAWKTPPAPPSTTYRSSERSYHRGRNADRLNGS
ncbi:hypothetical protein Q2K19_32480 [Micromonospora soli]|uniref:hypothetical protein n=1 Tax=Micromonospora sp. NBRC 110009 TaxID=3061627 RepID=UPI002671355B|nr:hypothetical protein [Micromonospora sp. NBRC 110009]WKT98794.1 hypothetical protein Q2K19_32480 [Micromonospora sp. NBRC 110009]